MYGAGPREVRGQTATAVLCIGYLRRTWPGYVPHECSPPPVRENPHRGRSVHGPDRLPTPIRERPTGTRYWLLRSYRVLQWSLLLHQHQILRRRPELRRVGDLQVAAEGVPLAFVHLGVVQALARHDAVAAGAVGHGDLLHPARIDGRERVG